MCNFSQIPSAAVALGGYDRPPGMLTRSQPAQKPAGRRGSQTPERLCPGVSFVLVRRPLCRPKLIFQSPRQRMGDVGCSGHGLAGRWLQPIAPFKDPRTGTPSRKLTGRDLQRSYERGSLVLRLWSGLPCAPECIGWCWPANDGTGGLVPFRFYRDRLAATHNACRFRKKRKPGPPAAPTGPMEHSLATVHVFPPGNARNFTSLGGDFPNRRRCPRPKFHTGNTMFVLPAAATMPMVRRVRSPCPCTAFSLDFRTGVPR